MREILFRGKTIVTGRWIEGLLWKKKYDSNKIFISYFPDKDDNEDALVVDPETVCQYTGVMDKAEKKIFEGDVVEGLFLFGMSINAVATFKDGSFGLKWYRGSIEEFSAFSCFHNVTFEVIGNIFDNPELMEGGVSDE